MGEVVSLARYRLALEVVESRKKTGKWFGKRFKDIEYFTFFRIPNFCENKQLLYVKVDENAALPWSYCFDDGPGWICGVHEPLPISGGMPVVIIRR